MSVVTSLECFTTRLALLAPIRCPGWSAGGDRATFSLVRNYVHLPGHVQSIRMSANCPRTVRIQSLQVLTGALNKWSSGRERIVMEGLQSSTCLWNAHCAEYKNRNTRVKAIDYLAEIWSQCYWSWGGKNSPLAKYRSVTPNLIGGEISIAKFSKCLLFSGANTEGLSSSS